MLFSDCIINIMIKIYSKNKFDYYELLNNFRQMGGKNNKHKKYIVFVRHGESTQNQSNETKEEYDINNITLTEKGIEQSTITGKYLKNVFKKFDIVYTSPIVRCVETAKIINDQLKLPNTNLLQDSLLIETGEINHNLNGLSYEQREKIINGNINVSKLEKRINDELNPFKKLELSKQFYKIFSDAFEVKPDYEQIHKNYVKFLNKIKRSKYNNILIIGHCGTLLNMQKIICGISLENDMIKINPTNNKNNRRNTKCGNCAIMCVELSHDGNFELISPPNNFHLADIGIVV